MTQTELNKRQKSVGRRALILFGIIFLFAVFAPIVPTTALGGTMGGHLQVLGSISYVLSKGSFGFTYWNGGYYFGGPPVP